MDAATLRWVLLMGPDFYGELLMLDGIGDGTSKLVFLFPSRPVAANPPRTPPRMAPVTITKVTRMIILFLLEPQTLLTSGNSDSSDGGCVFFSGIDSLSCPWISGPGEAATSGMSE
ncbi:hypothetical protein V2G26_016185 [Clonostachys chloroleuca]